MLKMGFIGNGKSTNRYHLPFILERDNIEVKTIYNRNPKTATWDKIEGVHYTTDLDELLKDPEIKLITISTTQSSHFEYAKMVLENGKNVLVEKPFMMTYDEAKEIFELAKERGLLVQCYQNRRFDSDFLTAQKVIESGKLGDLLEVEMHYDY
ncbi:Gfo/Idh/MocA family oxidoreductase, partial [Listeria innocua]